MRRRPAQQTEVAHLAGTKLPGKSKAAVGGHTGTFSPQTPKLAKVRPESSRGVSFALGVPAGHLPEVSTVRGFNGVGGSAAERKVAATEEPLIQKVVCMDLAAHGGRKMPQAGRLSSRPDGGADRPGERRSRGLCTKNFEGAARKQPLEKGTQLRPSQVLVGRAVTVEGQHPGSTMPNQGSRHAEVSVEQVQGTRQAEVKANTGSGYKLPGRKASQQVHDGLVKYVARSRARGDSISSCVARAPQELVAGARGRN